MIRQLNHVVVEDIWRHLVLQVAEGMVSISIRPVFCLLNHRVIEELSEVQRFMPFFG
jgi:hypothetical protein